MNWDAIGAIGEIVGASGVIFTLFYLAIQIRANTATTQGATANSTLRDARDLLNTTFQDRENTDLFLRGMENFDSLDKVDRAMFTNRTASFFLFWMNAFEQNRKGLLSPHLWDTFERDIPGFFASPGFHEAWSLVRYSFPVEYQTYIDEMAMLDASESPDYLAINTSDDA